MSKRQMWGDHVRISSRKGSYRINYAMGKYRKRFNEKARSGMLAKQNALKRARNKQFHQNEEAQDDASHASPDPEDQNDDPNAEILKPMTEEEKEDRKRKLKESLYAENEKESKLSRSKRKRLDKYIEHQIKREEKKVLLEKLSATKVDTHLFAPSKFLGKGKNTKREDLQEALKLEKQGRADEQTRQLLYEDRTVKDWDDESSDDSGDKSPSEIAASEPQSSFVDNRPSKFGGTGSGFLFSNIPKIEKDPSQKKYTWRLKVEREERKRAKIEDENDFLTSDESEEDAPELSEVSGYDETGTETHILPEDNDAASDNSSSNSSVSDDNEGGDESDESSAGSDEDEYLESEDDEVKPRLVQQQPKHSKVAESFKQWAEEQVRELEGRVNTALPELSSGVKERYAKGAHQDSKDSDDEDSVAIDENLQRKAFYVEVTRPIEIQHQRMQLPVFGEEHRIMEAVHHHDCIVLCGETGSGKTTQVPQFLYEAGFGNIDSDTYPGMIGVTQPRRVAAVSMANRVGNELGEVHGKRVGYQIRFDSTVANENQKNGTALKFMTDGVLLREMMNDFLLTKYSALIIDEAHERNVNTDILIGMLSRIVKLRRQRNKPLKLIIMSATLRVSDFAENKTLFKVPPPIIKVEARQYPVSVHFNKKTRYDYLEEAFSKACKIHKRLPPGGILIFLTGQNEITTLVKRLRDEFPSKAGYREDKKAKYRVSQQVALEAEDVDLDIALRERNAAEVDNSSSEEDSDEEEGFDEVLEPHQTPQDPLHVLPLYSLLPQNQQLRVFDPPPPGSRLCIVATNVAETSLTIPGIRYVIDCGRSKERKYDEDTGVQLFEVDWVSKASADQRSGRAGRTGPGHCYRLYSSAIYEEYFKQFSEPEILRMPAESTVLTMKSMGIDHIVNFPFPTPPDRSALARAEKLLVILGALDQEKKSITELGKTMSLFPLGPRYAKMLIVGNQLDCLPYVIAIVSALSVGDPFLDEQEIIPVRSVSGSGSDTEEEETQGEVEERRTLRAKFHKSRAMFSNIDSKSDAIKLLSAACALDHVPKSKKAKFVADNFLRAKVIDEIQKLRQQVAHIVTINTGLDTIAEKELQKQKLGIPSKQQVAALKQIIASGFIDQVAVRSDIVDSEVKLAKRNNISQVPYTVLHRPAESDEAFVYIHPGSVLTSAGAEPPRFLIYQTLNRSSNTKEGFLNRLRLKPLCDISGKQLANVAKASSLITYSKPLGHPYAPKDISSTKRECYVIPRYGSGMTEGGMGWDLPVIKVIQEKAYGQWVTKI